MKLAVSFLVSLVAALSLGSAARAADGATMYRCPGNEYNNTLSAKDAKDKGCKTIEGAPITVIQSVKPRAAAPTPSAGPAGSRVDPAEQRVRDNDSRRILEAELKREEDRLAAMKTEYANGQPERQGNEKNYQKYLERVADMKSAIDRKESDIVALKREISKQSP
jgi:type IV secretory pathway VirB10-like protein